MKLKHLITPVLLGVLSLGISQVAADEYGYSQGRGEQGARQFGYLKKKLELSDAQADAIKSIIRNSRQQAAEDATALRTLKGQIKSIMKQQQLDERRLRELASQAANHQTNVMIIRHQSRQLIAAQLTDEQNAKFDMFSEMRGDLKRLRGRQ